MVRVDVWENRCKPIKYPNKNLLLKTAVLRLYFMNLEEFAKDLYKN